MKADAPSTLDFIIGAIGAIAGALAVVYIVLSLLKLL